MKASQKVFEKNPEKLSPAQRRQIITFSAEKFAAWLDENEKKVRQTQGDWWKYFLFGVQITGRIVMEPPVVIAYWLWKELYEKKAKGQGDSAETLNAPFRIVELSVAEKVFNFPFGHPNDGAVYACCEIEPLSYIPLATFHDKIWDFKMSAFVDLCDKLKAKQCHISYREENGIEVEVNANVSGVGGVHGGGSRQKKTDASIYAEFDKPTEPIIETHEGWIVSEPSWQVLQASRLRGNVRRLRAEVNHFDEMGVNAGITTAYEGFNIDIGGTYKKMVTKKWDFAVEFWPKSKVPTGKRKK
jgi:hypothetical protein